MIWPVAGKEGIVAASNMAGKDCTMTDFFYGKSWTVTAHKLPIPCEEFNPGQQQKSVIPLTQ